MARYEEPRLMAAYSRLALMAGMDSGSGSVLEHLHIDRQVVAGCVPAQSRSRATFDRFREQVFAWHVGVPLQQDVGVPAGGLALPDGFVQQPLSESVPPVAPEQEPPQIHGQSERDAEEGVPETADAPRTRLYDWRVCVKLVENYRSHPALLKLPSQLFYQDELRAAADPVLTHSLAGWDELPVPGFPLIFYGIEGKDEQEGNSPSWMNVDEMVMVRHYVGLLLDYRASRLTAKDIGVVTPYQKQVQRMRAVLSRKGWDEVDCGSVEQFQGQERRVIIISTVRSSKEYIESDIKHNLGFLVNPKRFNVAITRPQALLIVIGNPHVLAQDAHWAALLRYAVDHGAYKGCELPTAFLPRAAPETVPEQEPTGMPPGDLDVAGLDGVSARTEQENPEWRGSDV